MRALRLALGLLATLLVTTPSHAQMWGGGGGGAGGPATELELSPTPTLCGAGLRPMGIDKDGNAASCSAIDLQNDTGNGPLPASKGGTESTAFKAIGLTGAAKNFDFPNEDAPVAKQPVNAQTGTTYTVLNTDRGKLVTHSNAGAIAVTLPQAGAGSAFVAGWFADVQNRGAGTVTITPTTSTIDGAASLALTTGNGVRIVSDGTNYFTMRGVGSATGAAGGDLTGTYPNPTIANNAVTNAKAADMANATVKCRTTAGTGDPEDCTGAQTLAIALTAVPQDNAVSGSTIIAKAVNAIGNLGATPTINWNSGAVQSGTLNLNTTIAFSNPVNGQLYTLILAQDATGSRTVTWPAAVLWPGGTTLAVNTVGGGVTLVKLYYDGTNYHAWMFGGTQAATQYQTLGTGAGVVGLKDASGNVAAVLSATGLNYCADAGASDTYACDITVTSGGVTTALQAYTTGMLYAFKANTANTGAATINFNSLGAKTIKKVAGGITTDLADNDIRVGQVVVLQYDGTNMQMQSTLGNAGGGGVGGSGTSGKVARFTAGTTIADASIIDDGTISTLANNSVVNAGTGSGTGKIGGVIHTNVTSTQCAAATNPADLMSFSLPANTLSADGKSVRVTAWGVFAANNNAKSVGIAFGATGLADREPAGTDTNNGQWLVTAVIARTGAATQTALGRISMTLGGSGNDTANNTRVTTPGETLSGAITIKLTGRCDSAATDVVQKGMIVEVLN